MEIATLLMHPSSGLPKQYCVSKCMHAIVPKGPENIYTWRDGFSVCVCVWGGLLYFNIMTIVVISN